VFQLNENLDSESVSAFDLGENATKAKPAKNTSDNESGERTFAAQVFRHLDVHCRCLEQEQARWNVVPDVRSIAGGMMTISLTCSECCYEAERDIEIHVLAALR
jgi:hypothetical protein